VKSLLRVASETTEDSWVFVDEPIAELAFCGQGFVVPAIEPPRINAPAQPRYVALVDGESGGSADRPTLRDPIRPAELVSLLDSISSHPLRKPRVAGDVSSPSDIQPGEVRSGAIHLATLLHGLGGRDREVFRIEFAGNVLHFMHSTLSLLVRKPINDEALIRVFDAIGDVRVTALTAMQAQSLVADGARPQPIDWLLWRTALRAPRDRLLPMLPENARFSLRRWPDFGRLKHDQGHMRMAARLTTSALGIHQLATSLRVPLESARAFINACALCGLIEVHAAAAPSPATVVRTEPPSPARPLPSAAAPTPSRYASIFRSIRSVLGLETF